MAENPTSNIQHPKFSLISSSVAETMELGRALAEAATPGTVVALYGDLGTGKTHLVKGVADGLGIDPATVRSPTFVIVRTYEEGRLPLYHFDAYRVGGEDEFVELGYEEYFFGEGVSVVEWPGRVESLLPADALRLHLTHVSETERRIERVEGDPSDEG
jgi:tRNA threonylcarbamoyladenosine biosynthesis protein TsaE